MTESLIEKYGLEQYIASPYNSEIDSTLENLISEISEEPLGIEEIAQKKLRERIVNQKYKQIDPSFLTMKGETMSMCKETRYDFFDKNQYLHIEIPTPRFAVYRFDNPHCEIAGTIFGTELYRSGRYLFPNYLYTLPNGCQINTPIAHILKEKIIEVVKGGIERGNGYGLQMEFKLKSTFFGLIPPTVKEKIKQNKKIFLNDIYLISEAEKWDCELEEAEKWDCELKLPTPINDPLLVGVLGGKCYLLDEFNCTPIEKITSKTNLSNNQKNKNNKKEGK